MKNIKQNRKGFTLVELLAVIVVLSVIMIFAVPTVLSSMNNAREASFKNYALKTLAQAQATYQAQSITNNYSATQTYTGTNLTNLRVQYGGAETDNNMTGVPTTYSTSGRTTLTGTTACTPSSTTACFTALTRAYCYSLEALGMTSTGNYIGYAIILVSPGHNVEYFISLTDGNRSISDRTTLHLNHSTLGLRYDTAVQTGKTCPTSFASAQSFPRAVNQL